MTDSTAQDVHVPDGDEQDTEGKPIHFTWRNRRMELKLPSGVQLMMWNRVATQFGEIGSAEEIDSQQFRKALNRLSDIVFGVLASPDDVEWLEDEIMAGRLADTDLLEMFGEIRNALSDVAESEEPSNRAQRRAKAKRVK